MMAERTDGTDEADPGFELPSDVAGEPDGAPEARPHAPVDLLSIRLEAEWATLEAELEEIELLVTQARNEAVRHEERRAAAAAKFEAARRPGNDAEAIELAVQLATLTRRAAVMGAQVDVLEGKLKVLTRFRDSLAATSEQVALLSRDPGEPHQPSAAGTATTPAIATSTVAEAELLPPAVSRIVIAAQEELRREIARTMHDGPAQSLTNIVLQAQIVDRLLGRDPERAAAEMRQLVSMVQQTLDATKSFIFDVRPMVLDDLGLMPTIRRAARERGRRAGILVEFESFGSDRRLTMDLESGLFRILDEALAAYLEGRPDRVTIQLDWTDGVEARVHAIHPNRDPRDARGIGVNENGAPGGAGSQDGGGGRLRRKPAAEAEPEALPAALAAMIESNRRAANRATGLPPATMREIEHRAAPLGLEIELLDDGRELRVRTGDAGGSPRA
jgi:signal transduction histidine kinase